MHKPAAGTGVTCLHALISLCKSHKHLCGRCKVVSIAPSAGAPPFDDEVDAAIRGSLQPNIECKELADYRLRHASAKTDAALQEMQRRVPLIAIW